MIKDNEAAYINKNWLTVQNYQFKILVMIAVLAENHLAYRGKLKDMCDFLGVGNTTSNTKKIKEAILKLEENGDIRVLKEGQTWTLTLSIKAEQNPRIIKIKNTWIKIIQQYQCELNEQVSWENILKVLCYLIADKTDVKRYDIIAKELGVSKDVVKRSIKALDNIDLGLLSIERKLAWFKTQEGEFKVIGQRFAVGYDFNKED